MELAMKFGGRAQEAVTIAILFLNTIPLGAVAVTILFDSAGSTYYIY